jgi:hypothetical protein
MKLMGRDEEGGEPSRYGLDTPRLMAPEEMGAGATSPRAALPKMPASVPCTTKSCNKFPAPPQPSQHRHHPAQCRLCPAPLLPMAPPVTDGRLEPMMCDSSHQGTIPSDLGSMAYIRNLQHMRTWRTSTGKTKGGASWMRALHPQCPMMMAPPSRVQRLQLSMRATEPTVTPRFSKRIEFYKIIYLNK